MYAVLPDGTWVRLPADEVVPHGTSGLVIRIDGQDTPPIEDALLGASELSEAACLALARRNLLSRFFTTPEAAVYMPEEALKLDTEGLAGVLDAHRDDGPVLFVCAGSGPLAGLLASRGFRVDAMDFEEAVLDRLRERHDGADFGTGSLSYLLADAANYARPGAYGAAFCPLNGIRYLGGEARVRRHLRLMRLSLVNGGSYLIHTSFGADVWSADWESSTGDRVTWSSEAPDHRHREVMERVVYRGPDGRVVADDRHVQAVFDFAELLGYARDAGFAHAASYTDLWKPLSPAEAEEHPGNQWLHLVAHREAARP